MELVKISFFIWIIILFAYLCEKKAEFVLIGIAGIALLVLAVAPAFLLALVFSII